VSGVGWFEKTFHSYQPITIVCQPTNHILKFISHQPRFFNSFLTNYLHSALIQIHSTLPFGFAETINIESCYFLLNNGRGEQQGLHFVWGFSAQ